MYEAVPTILRPEELLDKSLGRASKITKEDPEYEYRVKKTTLAKLESTVDTLCDTLQGYVRAFPNLQRVDTYERELIDIVIGVRVLQRSLSRVEGAADLLRRLGNDSMGAGRRTKDPQVLKGLHRSFVGRASSVVDELAGPLRQLANAREIFRSIPEVSPEDPTIVFAGYPNVGKSSLLARLTKARPDIAPYAFTTKQINVGHFQWPETRRGRRYQLVDTPGLLDKPPSERNKIERQAALALAYLADLIVFIFDPSETGGYTMPQQEALLKALRKEYAGLPFLIISTKKDLKASGPGTVLVSATTGEGVADLKAAIIKTLPEDPYEGVLS